MSENNDPNLPDLRYVRELAKVFKNYALDEVEIETGQQRISLRRGAGGAVVPVATAPVAAAPVAATPSPVAAAAPAAASPASSAGAAAEESGDFITSPFVGTFYTQPNPDSDVFVKVGDSISSGTTVCIVEAMKLFNEIEVDFDCVIEEVLVKNGEAVEFGAKLFRVRKS